MKRKANKNHNDWYEISSNFTFAGVKIEYEVSYWLSNECIELVDVTGAIVEGTGENIDTDEWDELCDAIKSDCHDDINEHFVTEYEETPQSLYN